ncbi:ubiquinol-cytochrome c reductase iron-sulfur subunit [Methylobacterium sp. Leaf106]|uniref:ubiquinol-cytochrome c reductase iron-sulfur subunit n=1 Tax=Methylobacterium sp. Leaf106 TaxID=1736255 RepID=UPI0006F8AB74|nr:ubiquinol-cytochrome c reductase iron-sulfur subunit [Methylobacterium sp. Leaf106]KQP53602.1 ubiquinol-cytochrome c reductase iron-sulfur subunit [Methylobacterium sp. Leaf106]
MANTPPISGPDGSRRDFLFLATGAGLAVGAGALAWPFVASMAPDAEVIAAGAPLEVDLTPIQEGQIVNVFWRGKLIFVRNRSEKEIKESEAVKLSELIDPQPDSARVKEGHAKWLVVYGNCTHLGCVPIGHQGQYEGWSCPCHGSLYDTSGRVRRGPAPTNLPVPPYAFLNDTKIRIGEDGGKAVA